MNDLDRPVLVAWEQGGNLGHLVRIRAIVDLLHRQALKVVLAVSQPIGNKFVQELAGIPCAKVVVRQGVRQNASHSSYRPYSFAGLLSAQGWADDHWLRTGIQSWVNLCTLTKPKAVVLDYAPVASLAACILRIPALHVSSGFDAPPLENLSLGRLLLRQPDALSAENSEIVALDACIARAIAALGIQCSSLQMREVLAHPKRLLDCLPQTDPYGARTNAIYAPFLSPSPTKTPAAWPDELSNSARARAFVYIRDHAVAEPLLDALVRRKVSTLCFWPGYKGHLPFTVKNGISIHAEPLDLNDVFVQASLVVSYGSLGISTRAVLAGLPHIVIPSDVEKGMVAQRLHEQGLGVRLHPMRIDQDIDHSLDALLSTTLYRERCESSRQQAKSGGRVSSFDEELVSAIRQLVDLKVDQPH